MGLFFWNLFVCDEDIYMYPTGRYGLLLADADKHSRDKQEGLPRSELRVLLSNRRLYGCMYLYVSLLSDAVHKSRPGSSPSRKVGGQRALLVGSCGCLNSLRLDWLHTSNRKEPESFTLLKRPIPSPSQSRAEPIAKMAARSTYIANHLPLYGIRVSRTYESPSSANKDLPTRKAKQSRPG